MKKKSSYGNRYGGGMLRNYKIRTRLFAGFGVVILFLLVMGIISLRNITEQRRAMTQFYDQPFTVTNAMRDAELNIVKIHRGMKDMVLYAGDKRDHVRIIKGMDDAEAAVYRDLTLARERFMGDKTRIDEIKRMMDEWKPIRTKTLELIAANRKEQAIAWHKIYARDLVSKIETVAKEVLDASSQTAERLAKESMDTQRIAFITTFLLSLLAVICAGLTALAITASIVDPMHKAVLAADQLATGDLSAEIDSDAQDETGQLLRAVGSMTRSLRKMGDCANRISQGDLEVEVIPNSPRDVFGVAMKEMVESLRRMAFTADRIAAGDLSVDVVPASAKDRLGNSFAVMVRNLRELNREISECVNVLSGSASEILTTVSEFASTSSETASAVSETNATVQEVRQTTDLASQKSKQVYERSQNAVAVAKVGRKSVEEAIGGMKGIDERMSFIAEKIVNLSEQSQAIGEIIATVGDLAEQSNLLAVNAAIEAAKAGEHGKGFAVVAQEVKNLALQSKQATAQVRGILGYIQKATTAAVLATEQGSKAVEAGVKQSSDAGESIRLLAESIEDSSNSTLQIVTSTQEQAVGMDQIAIAIQSINQASNQNVEGSRQIEAAARNLYELNQKLQHLVSRFKVA